MKSVFFGEDYITITKQKEVDDWTLLKPEIFAVLMDYLQSEKPIVNEGEIPKGPEDTGEPLRFLNVILLYQGKKKAFISNLVFVRIFEDSVSYLRNTS